MCTYHHRPGEAPLGLFLRKILAGHVSNCDCRRHYNKIYFCELFLAAHFSQKFEKCSDKVPIYCTWESIEPDDKCFWASFLLLVVVQIVQTIFYALTSKQNEAHIYVGTVIGAITIKSNLPKLGDALPPPSL